MAITKTTIKTNPIYNSSTNPFNTSSHISSATNDLPCDFITKQSYPTKTSILTPPSSTPTRQERSQPKKAKWCTNTKWGPHWSHALFFSSLSWPPPPSYQFTRGTHYWSMRVKLGNCTRLGKGRQGSTMEATVAPRNTSWTRQSNIHFRLVNFLCSSVSLCLFFCNISKGSLLI